VILVTGARQVGKTTMLKHLAESERTYVTMDNAMARELAQSDPVLFFQTYKPPILIDEVQKARYCKCIQIYQDLHTSTLWGSSRGPFLFL
jgi:predicted AAA+ superfamily ATPase